MKHTKGKYAFIEEEMRERAVRHRKRFLRPITPLSGMQVRARGRTLVNFSSNDYLGLSKHPLLKKRASEFIHRYGAGSTASRLICGTYRCFENTEHSLASLKGTESALIFNSGFQTNASLLPALADRNTLILSDWLNHNSIIQGALLSRCRVERFRHNDMAHLRRLLEEHRGNGFSRTLVVTESVFSVDGDTSDVDTLVDLSEEFQALLIVDEAHATGVLGRNGMGLCCGKGVDITIGTFGKACGSFGAYIACSRIIQEYLINRCSGFIYTTALPPSVVGSIDAALEIIPGMERERRDLQDMATTVRASLQKMGFSTGRSATQIIPVIIGDDKLTVELSAWLEKSGLLATAIRPPTVEERQSRIRLALSALHTAEDIDRLIHAFGSWGRHGA